MQCRLVLDPCMRWLCRGHLQPDVIVSGVFRWAQIASKRTISSCLQCSGREPIPQPHAQTRCLSIVVSRWAESLTVVKV